jgi:CRP-like cAMP-binding protein/Na+-translocating ferredoxin:NAD+ oxidoreductase RNF subunit RnfB
LDRAQLLDGFEILKDATAAERQRLVTLGTLRRVPAGETIVRQGDFGGSMYFLLHGSAVLRLRRFDGHEMVLGILGQGTTFGELGLAGDRPRAATVTANADCDLLEVDRDAFARAAGKNPAVLKQLDRAYRRAAIHNNLYSDPLFSDLPYESLTALVDRARMHAYEKEAVIFEEGDEGEDFFIVWSGHVRIVSRGPGGEERIFAYVAEGDYFGEMALLERRPRGATVVANDHVEVIVIARRDFEHLLVAHPAVRDKLRERGAARAASGEVVRSSDTRQVFLADMLRLGAAFASSALVINLDVCTRCGACSAACHELYGNSRLTRRGATFVLPDTHQTLLMPNSCWHCKDPECMKGCPTDALRRGPTGEIHVLVDRCIGCKICANNCPWGNITMADPPEAPGGSWLLRQLRRWLGGRVAKPRANEPAPGLATAARAVKCDLCEGKPASACVMACPYGAIARVDPNVFLRRAMEG